MVETILTVVLEVVKCFVPPTERQFGYLRSYNENFENLKKEIEEMKGDRGSVQHKIDEANRQGEDIEEKVDKWLESVNRVIVEAEELVGIHEATPNKQCFKGLCPNLKARLQLSKDAVRQLEAISKLREAGRLFDRISYRSIPDDVQLFSNRDYDSFSSRMSTLNNILGALKDPDVNMIGIYGMGGIGKTTLSKEVARQVKGEFDQVVFAEVSQSRDIRKIQGEIADKLGLRLDEESESGRARCLCNRLRNEKRILIILDNIWENLDLQAVGIPHGDDHKGCKVLLTTRSEDVLSRKMDSQRNFLVGVLKEEEAWSLFRKMAGDYIESRQFKSVAIEVAKECAGLPVSIVTVARALRNKALFEWEDALEQLKSPSSTNFQNIQAAAYSAIEWSYKKLEGEELKQIFLLIAYTNMTHIDELFMYGIGLGLFGGIHNLKIARARVRTLVNKLKASCMLLDHRGNDDDERFSMHDVVRDVAISIASREQNVLTVSNGELFNQWESPDESRVKRLTSIVLLDAETYVLPEELECPGLKLFFMRATWKSSSLTIPDNFFAKMRQVRVVDLTHMHLLSLPSSLVLLANLRTLRLYDCELPNISMIGSFKKLEFLSLQGSSIRELPEEVGQLTLLRLLDLRDCRELKVVPPNVLSKLSLLEELYIYSFKKWGEEVEGLKNASLDELKYLPNLTSLALQINGVNPLLPRGLFFDKLERFNICIGDYWRWQYRQKPIKVSTTFTLELNANICLKDGLIVQLKGVEDICLSGLQELDVKYFVRELVKVGSLQLKRMFIKGCVAPNSTEAKEDSISDVRWNEIISDDDSLFVEKVELPNLERMYLYSLSVGRIWQSQLAAMSCGVQSLTHLEVINCRSLKCLFSYSMLLSSSCVRLQNLTVGKCPVLEEIVVMDDQTERKNVMFPWLQFLVLIDLEKITSFCTEDVHVEFPSLKELRIEKCPELTEKYKNFNCGLTKKVSAFPNLVHFTVEEKYMPWICQFTKEFHCKLKDVEVIFEDESTIISSLDLLHRFHTIKFLIVTGGSMRFVNHENGMMMTVIRKVNKSYSMKNILKPGAILDNLERLEIMDMECDNLMNLVPSFITFHNLSTLVLEFCRGLKKLLTSSTAKTLVRLREMSICVCYNIIEIVANDDEGDINAAKDDIIFYELKKLELRYLTSLTSFCSSNYSLKFPSLETLELCDCPDMKVFCEGELSTPKLLKVLRNYEELWIRKSDLNTTIQQQYLKEVKSSEEDSSDSEEDIGQSSMQNLE